MNLNSLYYIHKYEMFPTYYVGFPKGMIHVFFGLEYHVKHNLFFKKASFVRDSSLFIKDKNILIGDIIGFKP
jgi:hypothetical protein